MKAFGRRLRVTIYSPDSEETTAVVFESNTLNGERGLKIKGVVNTYFAVQPPDATIEIYNLSPLEVAGLISLRMKKVDNQWVARQLRIKVEAGYTNGNFGQIFDGEILKPNMVKPDANNTVLQLTCLDGANFMSAGSVLTQTFNDGLNFYSVATQVANGASLDIPLYVSDKLKEYNVDGSFATKDTAFQTLSEIADETDAIFSYYDGSAYLRTYNDILDLLNLENTAYVLNADTGLIGFPSLSTSELTVQSVLNPLLKPMGLIRLNNNDISINQPEYLSNRQIGAWLAGDGLYMITQVVHNFDTTTDAFTTECKCLSRDYLNYVGVSE